MTRRSPRPALRALPTWMCSTRSRGRIWWCCASASGRTRPASGSTSARASRSPSTRCRGCSTAPSGTAWRPGWPSGRGRSTPSSPTSTASSGSLPRGSSRHGFWRAPTGMSRRCAACSIPSCRRRRSPALTWSATRPASCWFWRTICECRRERPSRSPCAKRSRRSWAPPLRRGELSGYASLLGAAIAAAAPADVAEPAVAILSDGAESGTYYEHRRFSRELAIPIVTPRQLELSRGRLYRRQGRRREQVHVLYRRTDEDRLSTPDGEPHRPRRAAAAGPRIGPGALRQRLRHRRRRRQAGPRLRRGDGPLLSRRGAAAALGAELRPRRRERRAGGCWSGSTSWC